MVTKAVSSSLRKGPLAIRKKFEPAERSSFAIGRPYKRKDLKYPTREAFDSQRDFLSRPIRDQGFNIACTNGAISDPSTFGWPSEAMSPFMFASHAAQVDAFGASSSAAINNGASA